MQSPLPPSQRAALVWNRRKWEAEEGNGGTEKKPYLSKERLDLEEEREAVGAGERNPVQM